MVFDAAGNLSSYAGKTFTHGGDGRLSTTTTGAGTVTYQYDGFGRRVSKSGPATLVPGGFVRYVYDAAHHLVGEYKANGSPIKEYVWLGDLPVAMVIYNPDSTTTAYAIETDHLGTPRLLTDATRAPRWRWTSPPFGEVLPEDDPSGLGAVTFNLRFPGQYYDKETGLHYNWNRYYDSGTGRYVQSDPIGLQGGRNTYGYVGGNPLSFADPTGEIAIILPALPAIGEALATAGSYLAGGTAMAAILSMSGDSRASLTPSERAQQAKERKEYSRICKSPVPSTGNMCQDAKANRDRLKQCLQLRKAFSKKWFDDGEPGHVSEIENTERAIEKLEQFLRDKCPEMCS